MEKDLITQKFKLKDVLPDLAKDFDDDVEFIRKGITPSDMEVKEGERAIISYINTGAKDRDNEIVLPSGADFKDYRKNPVVLFGHNYSSLPIGKNMWIKSDEKGLIAKTQYATHDEAEKVYQYRKDGFPLAESIGFIPIKTYYQKWSDGTIKWDDGDLRILEQDYGLKAKDLKDVRAVYVKWTMLEYSDVAVPSNPEAMELAKSKGLIPEKDKEKSKTGDADIIKHADDCQCSACVNARKNLGKDADLSTKELQAQLKQHIDGIKELTDSVTELREQLKELQENRAHEQHEQEEKTVYYSFDFGKDIEDEEHLDYAEIVKEAVKSVLKSDRESTLTGIKKTTKEVLETMSGKVIQS